MTDDEVLAPYHRWLLKMATVYMPWNPGEWQDLAQEGYIAMWKALRSYNMTKGSLPTWLTGAAKLRMKDCAHRETWTGTLGARGHTRERPATPLDPQEIGHPVNEMTEGIMLAYHRGEIQQVMSGFSPSVKEALYRKFWLDEVVPHGLWSRAIPVLAERLAHLRTSCD